MAAFWSGCLAIWLISGCSAGLLRVPKVYNAIISSGDNLTPSRAFPVIQPVVHETALGYPLSPPLLYHSDLKQPSLQQIDNADIFDMKPSQQPESKVAPDQMPKDQPKEEPPKEQNQQQQSTENPLKLNQFGLPPSLVPINEFNHRLNIQYDPYNISPYYTDPYNGLVLPYNNLFSPYYSSNFPQPAFNPYLLQSPFYNVPPAQQGGEQPQQPGSPGVPGIPASPVGLGPQWPNQNWPPQQIPQGNPGIPQGNQGNPQEERPHIPNAPPPFINVKNNSNKNPDIPDVPPPPLPVSGQKQEQKSS